MSLYGGSSTNVLVDDERRLAFDAWLAHFESSPVKNMEELVQFHKDHADVCLPAGK